MRDKLIEEWEMWCAINGFEPLSADELLIEYALLPSQELYVHCFITRWEMEV